MPCQFNKGDIVVLKTGEAPQRVLDVCHGGSSKYGWAIRAQYLNDPDDNYGTSRRWRAADDFKPYEGDAPETETTDMANELYQTKTGDALFGTLLARNSAGRLVLEIKGTGQVRDFAPDEVEVVRPYTVRVRNVTTGQQVHRTAAKGSVVVGDVLLHGGALYEVEAIDTKSGKPSGTLTGRKLVTEKIAEVADDEAEG